MFVRLGIRMAQSISSIKKRSLFPDAVIQLVSAEGRNTSHIRKLQKKHGTGGQKMYKCCWNCFESAPAAHKSRYEMRKLRASKRFCCATYPVSNRLEDPFKQRFCKQFIPNTSFTFGHEITKKEAENLSKMNVDELLEYWYGGLQDGN